MNQPVPQSPDATSRRPGDRSVVLVTSPGTEPTLSDVALNLATVCAEVGQRVVLLSTANLALPAESAEEPAMPALWWLHWPAPEGGTTSLEEQRLRLQTDALQAADVEALLGETEVQGVRRLDLRYFVKHPAQVVIRVPQVVTALRQIVDVVILEVPSYLTVHYGEGLTPLADAIVVVGERDSTKVDALRRTRAALTRLAAPVVGVVLTGGSRKEDVWEPEDLWEPEEGEADPDPVDEESLHDTERLWVREVDKAPVSVSPAALDDNHGGDGGNGHRAKEPVNKEHGAMEDESLEDEPADTVAVANRDAPEA
jgi:hypothetical protein